MAHDRDKVCQREKSKIKNREYAAWLSYSPLHLAGASPELPEHVAQAPDQHRHSKAPYDHQMLRHALLLLLLCLFVLSAQESLSSAPASAPYLLGPCGIWMSLSRQRSSGIGSLRSKGLSPLAVRDYFELLRPLQARHRHGAGQPPDYRPLREDPMRDCTSTHQSRASKCWTLLVRVSASFGTAPSAAGSGSGAALLHTQTV